MGSVYRHTCKRSPIYKVPGVYMVLDVRNNTDIMSKIKQAELEEKATDVADTVLTGIQQSLKKGDLESAKKLTKIFKELKPYF